jgi:hypothetical protein
VFRPTIEARKPLAGLKFDIPAKFGCDHNLISEGFYAFAKYSFDLVGTVSLGGIIES